MITVPYIPQAYIRNKEKKIIYLQVKKIAIIISVGKHIKEEGGLMRSRARVPMYPTVLLTAVTFPSFMRMLVGAWFSSPFVSFFVMVTIATPMLQRIPKEMRNPMLLSNATR